MKTSHCLGLGIALNTIIISVLVGLFLLDQFNIFYFTTEFTIIFFTSLVLGSLLLMIGMLGAGLSVPKHRNGYVVLLVTGVVTLILTFMLFFIWWW